MAIYNKLKYFGKMIKNGDRSAITEVQLPFIKSEQQLPASTE